MKPAGAAVKSAAGAAGPGLDLTLLPGALAVCRLPAGAAAPAWLDGAPLASVTRTPDETSVVCGAEAVPAGVRAERGWRALRVAGPLDFALTGVLLSLLAPLAAAGVAVFALSTFDTDYLLVKEAALDDAVAALAGAGHRVAAGTGAAEEGAPDAGAPEVGAPEVGAAEAGAAVVPG